MALIRLDVRSVSATFVVVARGSGSFLSWMKPQWPAVWWWRMDSRSIQGAEEMCQPCRWGILVGDDSFSASLHPWWSHYFVRVDSSSMEWLHMSTVLLVKPSKPLTCGVLMVGVDTHVQQECNVLLIFFNVYFCQIDIIISNYNLGFKVKMFLI